ncbi:MAG: hypothetical protein KF861_12680 [Planctomycetaceae bacterium]|nr:hypothetical protein [Planctomycetaceae bacterium]
MLSPFEELEFLSNYLPEEGETVLVSRRSGELVCESFEPHSLREGVADPQLYGMLVHANERLNGLGSMPLWATAIGFFWGCVALAYSGVLRWNTWYLVPGLLLLLLPGSVAWIRLRQHRRFQREIRPMLEGILRFRRIDPHTLLGAVRQHEELRTLLDELVRRTVPLCERPVHPEMRM